MLTPFCKPGNWGSGFHFTLSGLHSKISMLSSSICCHFCKGWTLAVFCILHCHPRQSSSELRPHGCSVLSTIEQGFLWKYRDTGRVAKIILVKDTQTGSAEVTTATPRPRSPQPVLCAAADFLNTCYKVPLGVAVTLFFWDPKAFQRHVKLCKAGLRLPRIL